MRAHFSVVQERLAVFLLQMTKMFGFHWYMANWSSEAVHVMFTQVVCCVRFARMFSSCLRRFPSFVGWYYVTHAEFPCVGDHAGIFPHSSDAPVSCESLVWVTIGRFGLLAQACDEGRVMRRDGPGTIITTTKVGYAVKS